MLSKQAIHASVRSRSGTCISLFPSRHHARQSKRPCVMWVDFELGADAEYLVASLEMLYMTLIGPTILPQSPRQVLQKPLLPRSSQLWRSAVVISVPKPSIHVDAPFVAHIIHESCVKSCAYNPVKELIAMCSSHLAP